MLPGRLAAACALALATPAQAAHQDSQFWGEASADLALGKWSLSEEVITRFSHEKDGLYEVESNTLLGYAVTEKLTLSVGYLYVQENPHGRLNFLEQQATFTRLARFAGGAFDARLRLEERWKEGAEGTGWGLRPYIRYVRPFKKGGKTTLVISHESFINLNRTSFQSERGYSRMRNEIALSTPLVKNVVAEVGYLNQYTLVRHGEDTMDHAFVVSIGMTIGHKD